MVAGLLHRFVQSVNNGMTTAFIVLVATLILGGQAVQSGKEANIANVAAADLADPVASLCAGSAGPEVAERLSSARTPSGESVCDKAAVVRAQPSTASGTTQADDAHMISLIRAEFARRPAVPATASPEQINSAVSQVIMRNPELFRSREVPIGAPPAQPDQRQINAAVSTYLSTHPDQFRGAAGQSGRPGEAVTRTVQAPPVTTTLQQPPATVTQTMQPDPRTETPPATDPPVVEPPVETTPGAGATPTDTPSPSRNFAPQMRTRSTHQEPLLRLRPPL